MDSAQRFRVEVLFSPGASHNPYTVKPVKQDHTLPVRRRAPLHRGVIRLLHPAIEPLPRRAGAEDMSPWLMACVNAGTGMTWNDAQDLLAPLSTPFKPTPTPRG